ncbi:MAG: NADPH-dependent FMN reductase [Chlorobiaceae bacterium]|nr:NADPH-dependent FMN reductase [Chlorobiaceae bacterium]
MKTLILDGSPADDLTGLQIAGILKEIINAEGHEAEHIVLRDKTIGNCNGCFQCWLKTPGICAIDDDNREISRKFIESDQVIMLTPVSFGVYAPELKKMADHLIPNTSPFFIRVNGETHHRPRYETYPCFVTIGWLDSPDPVSEGIFRHLVYRNSINFYSDSFACGILYRTGSASEMKEQMKMLLSPAVPHSAPQLPVFPLSADEKGDVHNALLLVGSPRMGKSTSAALGEYLFDQLGTHGVETETLQLYKALNHPEKTRRMLEAIDSADLIVLAFPLYIDSIPAPVLSAMRIISKHRQQLPSSGRFAAIANCGFIESFHNDNALAACAVFAKSSGFDWMGSVSIGGGEGLVQGRPLQELGGPVIPYKKNLDIVAEALAAGHPVPEEARLRLAKPFVPGWIYRIAGTAGWKKQARQYGTEHRLDERPYQPFPRQEK